MMISRRALLLAGAAFPASAFAQCVTGSPSVDACLGGVRQTTPSASLDLDFLTPGSLNPALTFTRASTGTYFDNTGTMQTAAVNAPRWDYDTNPSVLRGLLIEEARTNLILQSQFAASWTTAGSVLTANAAASPAGSVSAATLQEDATTGLHDVLQSITKAASGVTYAVSFYVKQGVGTRNLKIQVDDAGSGNGMSYVVTPTTGAIVAGPTMIGAGWASVGAMTYTTLPNGWGRFAFVVSTAATTTFRILLLMATGTNQSYAGDNTSTIQLYGFQVEAASFESSYIPTTTVAVTRAAEYCSLPTGAWFNATASSLAVDYMLRQSPNPSAANRVAAGLGDGSVNNRMFMTGQSVPAAAAIATSIAGVTTGSTSLGNAVANAVSKIAGAWGGGSMLGALNAGSVVTTAVGMPAGITTLFVGTSTNASGAHLNGHIRRVRYWPLALAPADLQAVTT